jgi:uncharacterized protein (TIGR02270 family)
MIPSIDSQVFEQHAIEASILWPARDAAVDDPLYDLPSLRRLDERLEANLDGLRLAGEGGWAASQSRLESAEAGDLFTAAVLALHRGDVGGLAQVIDVGGGDPLLARGFVSALGWSAFDDVRRILPALLDARCPPELHYLGIAACAIQRHDPGQKLGYAASSSDLRLRARALRAAGELRRGDLLPDLRRHFDAEQAEVRWAAAWGAALLGEHAAVPALCEVATGDDEELAAAACAVAARRGDPAQALRWIDGLSRTPSRVKAALAGAAALGDPGLVPFILECAREPAWARTAGFALSMITGVELRAELAGVAPEGFRAGPSEDPADGDVALDPDESLAWPDVAALRAYWNREGKRFPRGTRHLLGKPITVPWLREVLRKGNQAARAAAALELCLRSPSEPLFEVRAPAFRQARELG